MSRSDTAQSTGPLRPDGRTLGVAAVGGVLAHLVGYALTYAVVGQEVSNSLASRVLEIATGDPGTWQLVGWVFYNAHMVETVFRDIPLVGSRATSYIGGEAGFTALLYAVPVALLFAVGLGVTRYRAVDGPSAGAVVGSTVVPGYLLAAVTCVFLFEVTVAGATGGPDLLPAVVLAGIVYPLVCAGGGGAVGGLLEARSRSQPAN